MNSKPYIHTLFDKLRDNSISEQELDELLYLVSESDLESPIVAWMEEHWEEIEGKVSISRMDFRAKMRFARIADKAGMHHKVEVRRPQTNPVKQYGYRWWIGIAASITLLVAVGIYSISNSQSEVEVPQSEIEIARAFHGKQIVTLPDGSTVILNEGSRLSYQENFGVKDRVVIFAGEGYFDIVPDPARPFVVHTGRFSTTVLGTAFNLIAYEDQPEIVVAVEHGEVTVGDEDQVFDHILPKEQLVVNTKTLEHEKDKVDLDRVMAWKEDFLILDNVSIADAASMIGKKFNAKINIENTEMKSCLINAAFLNGETLEQVLRVICGVLQAKFVTEEGNVWVQGGRSCK